jgi:hypothetical protein
MKLCPDCEVQAAIGSLSAGPRVNAGDDPLERGVSIETAKGGFGLYYRSPLVELGAVAPVGTPLGEESQPTPIEVLRRGDPRALALAQAFHEAVQESEYYSAYERTSTPIPRTVLTDLARRACLCRLGEFEAERDAIRALIFEPANDEAAIVQACDARRRAFALFLSLLQDDSEAALDTGRFRNGLIERFTADPGADDAHGRTVAAWAALAMKECIQEPICSIWTDFCRNGVTRQPVDGMSHDALAEMIGDIANGSQLTFDATPLAFSAGESTSDVQARLLDTTRQIGWTQLADWTANEDTASSGLAALLVLADRVPDPRNVHPLWGEIGSRRSENQDGLLGIASLTRQRLETNPTIGELMDWLIRRFVIAPHEVIAYSKLPKATFRFVWEENGHLRFYTPGTGGLGRFRPSDDRRAAMSTLTEDLGFWACDEHDVPRLTPDGETFVEAAFA